MTLTLTYVIKVMILSDFRQILAVIRQKVINKVNNYFPALYEESDNFRQKERYEVDQFKEYNFLRKTTFTPPPFSLPRGALQ